MQHAIAIQLPFWQDPQSSLALVAAQSTCTVFFALWGEAGEKELEQLGKITFTRCWATHTLGSEFLPYAVAAHTFASYLLEVPDSAWLAATTQQRLQAYPSWKSRDNTAYHHYLVQGADSYVEVLAAHFTIGLASAEECQRYAFLCA